MINDYELCIVFSFLSDESDRDTVYHVSRQFRRLYRHVAPTNSYFFAMSCGSIRFARRLFDSAYIVPSKLTLEVAFQRKQADHAAVLINRCGGIDNIPDDMRYKLMNIALSRHSRALVEAIEGEHEQVKINDHGYDDFILSIFQAVQDVPATAAEMTRLTDFLAWALDTRGFKWRKPTISMIAKNRYTALLDIFLRACSASQHHRRSLDQLVQFIREANTTHTDPFVQRALDSVFPEERDSFMNLLLDIDSMMSRSERIDSRGVSSMQDSFDFSIVEHLIYERGYPYLRFNSHVVKCIVRSGSTRYVFRWLSNTVAKQKWSSFASVFSEVCKYAIDVAFVKQCFALAPPQHLKQFVKEILYPCFEPEFSRGGERSFKLYDTRQINWLKYQYDTDTGMWKEEVDRLSCPRFDVLNLFLRQQILVDQINVRVRQALLDSAVRSNAHETIRLLVTTQPSFVNQLTIAVARQDGKKRRLQS